MQDSVAEKPMFPHQSPFPFLLFPLSDQLNDFFINQPMRPDTLWTLIKVGFNFRLGGRNRQGETQAAEAQRSWSEFSASHSLLSCAS